MSHTALSSFSLRRLSILALLLAMTAGCTDGCGCSGEDEVTASEEESSETEPSPATEAPETPTPAQPSIPQGTVAGSALGGPLAGPEDRAEPEAGEEHGDTEEEMPTGDPATDTERETVAGEDMIAAGAYNPWDILPVEPGEGSDLASGLELLCELTRRVLALEGESGDPERLHTLLREGLQPHPAFAEVDALMMGLQEADPSRLYQAVQAAAEVRGVSGYECPPLAEVFRRMLVLGVPGEPGPVGDFDEAPEGATVVDIVPAPTGG